MQLLIGNTGDRTLDVSLPNLMTHAYYNQIHVTTLNGEAITLREDPGLGGPVGWRKLQMKPDTMGWVSGLPEIHKKLFSRVNLLAATGESPIE